MKRSQIVLLLVGAIFAGTVIATVVSARIALSYGNSHTGRRMRSPEFPNSVDSMRLKSPAPGRST